MDQKLPLALYVVATPLGNLEDLSPRAKRILASVAYIAAEDTRHSAPLLKHCGSRAIIFAAHQHNEQLAARRIVGYLSENKPVALISDAGTPAISDPGSRIVAQVRQAGFPITPIPGPCALAVALSISGIHSPHFLFYGFLPAKKGARRAALQELLFQPHSLVFYEAPHRLLAMLEDCIQILGGERRGLLAREISKLYETLHQDQLIALLPWLQADPTRQKGEHVVIIEPAADNSDSGCERPEANRVLQLLLAQKLPVKQCAKLAAQLTGGSKNDMYKLALSLKEEKK